MAKRKNITTTQLALMTAAAVISLRGLPMMAQEELTMFFYIFFATFLFLIPAALVGAELGSAFADRGGGVYTWVKEAFNRHLGFSAIFLQWIQNVVWYPTVLGFAAASIAYMIGVPALAQNGLYVGLFSIAMYWCATLVTLRGTQPKLIRSYRVPGGNTGMWLIGGVGFLAVLFSFIVTFFPPSQLPVGSPATYTWLVVTGTAVFLAIPFIISFAMDKRNARRTPEA